MKALEHRIAFAAAALVTLTRLAAQSPPEPAPATVHPPPAAANYDDTARFLAGLPPLARPELAELTAVSSWQRHAKLLDAAWGQLEKNQLSKVRTWAQTQIPDAANAKGTAFYMFSGPDFLYADTIYPAAETYVFCGVEPVGPLPDLAKLRRDQLGGELAALRSTLDSVLSFSFFLTKELKSDLQGHALKGTVPVLSIFLARAGKTICDAGYVGLDKEGKLLPVAEPVRGGTITAPGVKFTFRGADSQAPRTLYYFSTDISDSGLKSTGFLQFCKTLAPGNSLVKSASYLMHESYFSGIRGFLLENSSTLVEDDSGIPFGYFPPEQWQVRLFGAYPGPIPLFKNYTQPKLAESYRTGRPVPLDFGIGYRHRKGESTLIVATRRLLSGNDVPPPKAVPVAIPVDESTLAPPPAAPPSTQ